MTNVTNGDLYGVLLEIKEDIGSLKSSSTLQLEGLRNHNGRLNLLEGMAQRQRGAVKVWGLLATGAAAIVGAVPEVIRFFKH